MNRSLASEARAVASREVTLALAAWAWVVFCVSTMSTTYSVCNCARVCVVAGRGLLDGDQRIR